MNSPIRMPAAGAGAIRASAVAFGVLAASGWMAGAQAKTEILLNFFAPPKHIINTGIAGEWAKAVTKATNGRVTFKFPPNRWRYLGRVWGVVALFLLVLGGIYLGVFTPTEAAGIGAAGALLFALLRRKLPWREFVDALVEAGITSGMIFIVAFGALIFSNFVNLAGLTAAMVEFIQSLDVSALGVVIAMCAIYLLLGCVFDSLAMLLLTVPIFAAILSPLGVDLIWFGIVAIIVVEIGLITPPIGMNVFIVKTVLEDVSLWAIFAGVWPFVLASLIGLALIVAVPDIALLLPRLMG